MVIRFLVLSFIFFAASGVCASESVPSSSSTVAEKSDLESAYLECESVVVGEYVGYEKRSDISIEHPPLVAFQWNKYLKGSRYGPRIPVRYYLDKSKNQKNKKWKFSESMMPKKGDEFIVFIENSVPVGGVFETWKGAKGIVPASEENIKQMMEILKKYSQEMR